LIVVDASVLADALTDDGDVGDAARAALGKDEHWAAPDHLVIEVVSVIRGRHLGRKLSDQRAADALTALTQLFVDHVDVVPLIGRIWELRSNVNAYDAAYVAAAEALGCSLLTADAKLARANGVRCEIIEV
jgi:predicted nucleic acid-binding protein